MQDDLLHRIGNPVLSDSPNRVQHHLRIFLRTECNALTILEIHHMAVCTAQNDTVREAVAIPGNMPVMDFLFNHNLRRHRIAVGYLLYVVHIFVCIALHLRVILPVLL